MSENAVKTNNLRKAFGTKSVLNGIDLELKKGSVLGILGRNGSGKTTMIKIFMGLLEKNEGEVSVLGLQPAKDHVELMNRIGYVSESRDLYDWMTVSEIITFCRGIYKEWDDTLVEENRKRFSLPEAAMISDLSYGQRTMLCLLIALGHKPELLILDDPSAGLDIPSRCEILASIIAEAAEKGTSVLFSSHIIGEVERICDQVAILNEGVLRENDAMESLMTRFLTLRIRGMEGRLPDGLVCISRTHEVAVCVIEKEQESNTEITGEVLEKRSSTLEEIYLASIR